MKKVKISLLLVAAVAIVFGLSTTSFAFHSGGVAECEGCHSMHNSFEGTANVTGRTFAEGTGPFLLKANDASSTCLNCHQSADTGPTGYHISTAGVVDHDYSLPVEMTPGGDFAWLKKTMDTTVRGKVAVDGNEGELHGHSIVASDFGFGPSTVTTVAPGGTYPVGSLACSSCHDPHGRYKRDASGAIGTSDGIASGGGFGVQPATTQISLPTVGSGSYTNSADPTASVYAVGVYRILAGRNYQPKSLTGGNYTFASDPPAAVVASSYNRSEATSQTAIAYGQGMSEWCANCHSGMLMNSYTSGMAGLRHPAGNGAKLTSTIATNYNNWVKTGTSSPQANAFSTLAPYEEGSSDYTLLKSTATNTTSRTADTAKNVMCLSCHRAHASGFESSLRFYYLNEFMTIGDAAGVPSYDPSTTENKINAGYDVALQTNAYYGRPATAFAPWNRSYCNKCHAKD